MPNYDKLDAHDCRCLILERPSEQRPGAAVVCASGAEIPCFSSGLARALLRSPFSEQVPMKGSASDVWTAVPGLAETARPDTNARPIIPAPAASSSGSSAWV